MTFQFRQSSSEQFTKAINYYVETYAPKLENPMDILMCETSFPFGNSKIVLKQFSSALRRLRTPRNYCPECFMVMPFHDKYCERGNPIDLSYKKKGR